MAKVEINKVVRSLVILMFVVLVIAAGIFLFFLYKKSSEANQEVNISDSTVYNTSFLEEGIILQEGLSQFKNLSIGKFRITGKIKSNIYEKDSYNAMDVSVSGSNLILIFGPSDWPILTLFAEENEISPEKKQWRGKTKDKLNSIIKIDDEFVAYFTIPSNSDMTQLEMNIEEWKKLDETRKKYYEENWSEIRNVLEHHRKTGILKGELGLVNGLILNE